jgi:hypothetical protein
VRNVTRREALSFGGAVFVARAGSAAAADASKIAADLERYVGFGPKHAGGAADESARRWIETELKIAGFRVRRQKINVPYFETKTATISVDGDEAPLLPIGVVVQTGDAGVVGPCALMRGDGYAAEMLEGAVAIIDLPCGRWSSAHSKPIRTALEHASALGAIAALVITNGPTGEAIALNADGREPVAPIPSAVLAPKSARGVYDAAARSALARLRLVGRAGRRAAYNVVATLQRGEGRWLIISTPRSGWTECGGERGPGIAAFLALARWAPAAFPDQNIFLLCNSGHEYENLGAAEALRSAAPPPGDTEMWLHLGANLAARDWHETGGGLLPLPSPDPQRFLLTSEDLIEPARRIFAGAPGLESPYPSAAGSAGELQEIVASGYARTAGIFGAHRFHHVDGDDLRCVDATVVSDVIARLKVFLDAALRRV